MVQLNGGEPVILIDGAPAIAADYVQLIKTNPELQLPLTNIVQKRLLAEKDAEIAELKAGSEEVKAKS